MKGGQLELNFLDTTYLRDGTEKQRKVYAALVTSGFLSELGAYGATLVGTVPLGIDLSGSDLDIICYAVDLRTFEQDIRCVTRRYDVGPLSAQCLRVRGVPSAVFNFLFRGFPVEVFGQPLAIHRQHGYRHLLIEHRVLEVGGGRVRERVMALRCAGYKTETAFAALLGIVGDPYENLLQVESWSDEAITLALG